MAWLAFGVASFASLLMGAIACRNAMRLPKNLTAVTESFRIIDDLNNLLLLSTAAENQTRGYLFSGDSSYREMALQNSDAAVMVLKELEPIVAQFPSQVPRLRTLEPQVFEQVQFLEHCLEIRGIGGLSAALSTFQNSQKNQSTPKVEQTIRSMISEQMGIQMRIRRQADSWSTWTVVVVALANVLNLGVVGGALILIRQDATRLQKAEHSLRINQKRLEEANTRLQRLATEDGLTGIANRRMFDVQLSEEWKRARRSHQPLSLILLDVDHFKKFNDSFGHQRGDECLIEVARVLRESCRRPADLVARYGGEEFAALLPETELEGAKRIAERIRAAVVELEIANPQAPHGFITVSLGLVSARYGNEWQGTSQIIEAADQELYRAKQRGRNQVSAAEELSSEAKDGHADGVKSV